MISLIIVLVIIAFLVAVIAYLLNQRNEAKIKNSFDHLISPVEQDQLFDLPKAEKPAAPIRHEAYVPPSTHNNAIKDDLKSNSQLNAAIAQAENNIDSLSRKESSHAFEQAQLQVDLTQSIATEQTKRVNHLKDKLTAVQLKKRQLKKSQIRVKIEEQVQNENHEAQKKRTYDALKPKFNISVKK